MVEADHLVIEGSRIEASGAVHATLGPDRFEADSLTADPDGAELVHGRWIDDHGRIATFDRATIALADGRVDRLSFEHVELLPCGCEDPWALSARSASVDPERTAVLHGGWLRVLGRPLLPVPPVAIPLTRRSGLLLPSVGYGVDGLVVAQPVFLTLGPRADTTLAPEVRTARGVRGLGQLRVAGLGEADGAVGWDAIEQRVRGAASWSALTDPLSTVGQWWGDPDYQSTYGDSFLGRSLPWPEQRALARAGPIELGFDATQDRAPLHAFGAAYAPAVALGEGWLGSARLDLDRIAPDQSVSGTVGLEHPTAVGPIAFTPFGTATGTASSAGTSLHGAMGTELALLGWRPVRGGIERLEPGLDVTVADAGATLGADLAWRRTTARDQASLAGRVALGPGGWGAWVDGWWRTAHWSGWIQADRDVHGSAGIGVVPAPIGGGIGVWRADEGPWVAPWIELDPSEALRLRVAARAWTGEPALQSIEASVSWTHPTGCLSIGVVGRWDQDRALPDVGLTLGTR